MKQQELYVDGGVVQVNPSPIGGTYAWLLVDDGVRVKGCAYFMSAETAKLPVVTNNQTEMMALIKGLSQLPNDWCGCIYSDSAITLGRAFSGWKWKNVPEWIQNRFFAQRLRFIYWDRITYVQLDGHPTKAQLASGIGKRGNPVSIHNVWCDEACGKAGASRGVYELQ